MDKFRTPEAIAKRKETYANNLSQISNAEERETHINIDHYEQRVYVYTNNATVMNRFTRAGLEYTTQDMLDGQVYGRNYEVGFDKMNEVMKVTVYKCN